MFQSHGTLQKEIMSFTAVYVHRVTFVFTLDQQGFKFA